MDDFTAELARLAEAEARTPEGRIRLAAALRRTLIELEPTRFAAPAQPCACLVTRQVANAFDGLAAALSLAADHAACIAERASITAPPAGRPQGQ